MMERKRERHIDDGDVELDINYKEKREWNRVERIPNISKWLKVYVRTMENIILQKRISWIQRIFKAYESFNFMLISIEKVTRKLTWH